MILEPLRRWLTHRAQLFADERLFLAPIRCAFVDALVAIEIYEGTDVFVIAIIIAANGKVFRQGRVSRCRCY